MNVFEIDEENVDDFEALLGPDLSSDVMRAYFNGIGATDDDGSPVGAFVYELLNSESEEDTKSRIYLAKADSEEISDSLDKYYTENSVSEDETVESFYELEDEQDAKGLSERGFSFEKKEDETIRVTLGELGATKLGTKKKIPDHVGNIDDLSVLQFRGAIKNILFKGHKGILEDTPYLPKSWYDNKVSACINSGGKTTGLFLIRRTPSGVLMPVLFFAYGPEYKRDLLHMLHYSLQQALQLYPPETVVKIKRSTAATREITDKILPERGVTEIFFGVRKEK